MGRTWIATGVGVAAAVAVLGATSVAGATVRVGSIGDSISRAFDANDGCSNLVTCLPKIGSDLNSSWSTGDAGWNSVRDHLNNCNDGQGGCPSNITYVGAINGQRWAMGDAYNQAVNLVNSGGGVNFVTIEMGGNDVCRRVGEALPSYNDIYVQVDATFSYLASHLQPGSTVMTVHVPNINLLYQTMKNHSQFLEGTCQNLWNVGTSAGDGLTSDIASALGIEFPCGAVLSTASNDSVRAQADQLNQEINQIIDNRAAAYNGYNGVRFVVSGNMYEFQFAGYDVSGIDCFHPSRQGQTDFAARAWAGVGSTDGSPVQTKIVHYQQSKTGPQSYDLKVWMNQPGYGVFWIQNCNDPRDACYNVANCYLWTTNWSSNYFDTQVGGSWINPNDQYRIWSMPENLDGSYNYANQVVPSSCQ